MKDPARDEEFEAFLRRRSVLSRGEGAEKLEPPHDLDDIVLRKARQALQTSPQLPLYRAPRWALPVGLAATLLLTVSVLLNVGLNLRRPQLPAPATPQSGAITADRAIATAPSLAAESAARAKAPEPAPAAAPPAAPQSATPQSATPQSATPQPAAPQPATPQPAARDPQAWLRQIDELRAAGRTARAEEELRRFKAAFPAYPVNDPAVSPPAPPK